MGHAKQRILLVDDDPGIMVAVKQALSTHGYQMTTATDGKEALDSFDREPPELILLDLVMPQCSGLEVCKRIREYSATPIIILSVKGSEADIVSVLDMGADDYLVKPFGTEELVARIRAVLRRQADVTAGEPIIQSGDLEIDIGRRSVKLKGNAVRLTPTEYELLRFLALHAGKPVTHTMLLRQVWGDYAIGDKYNTRYVVAQIRKKLGDDPANPRYIVNEPGVGYRLQA